MNAAATIENTWVWMWYIRNWQRERDAFLKALSYCLGVSA